MHESKITARGQTTLPKAVREAMGLKPGDKVRYFLLDGHVQIRKVRPLSELSGILKYDGPPVTLEEMEEAIIAGATRRWSP